MNDTFVDQFEELLVLIESIRTDVIKHAGGNKSAGLRVRRALRDAQKMNKDIVRESVEMSR